MNASKSIPLTAWWFGAFILFDLVIAAAALAMAFL